MAKNWYSAQNNEKKFWEDIYLKKDNKDLIYSKTNDDGWVGFAQEILFRHKIDIKDLNNKVILDIGSGPGGLVLGLSLLKSKESLKFNKLIALDPLMNFFKKEINLFSSIDDEVELYEAKGERIPLESNSIDYVFCTNVIDHCEIPENVISEAYRILKPNGLFCPSLHLVYNLWSPIKNYLKYIDKNHPFHFDKETILRMLKKNFIKTDCTYNSKIIYDQPKFTFLNIFKSRNLLRGFKRFASNYILFTSYFKCKKLSN
ncbi:methylase involved in ubiquinone/menaquinone biosynthesis [alpha proteobacterium HIMB114]|nr:methylase involved in ubiquinone/menaquinone biosynthesis [alpha proteobacterium HIMB114]